MAHSRTVELVVVHREHCWWRPSSKFPAARGAIHALMATTAPKVTARAVECVPPDSSLLASAPKAATPQHPTMTASKEADAAATGSGDLALSWQPTAGVPASVPKLSRGSCAPPCSSTQDKLLKLVAACKQLARSGSTWLSESGSGSTYTPHLPNTAMPMHPINKQPTG